MSREVSVIVPAFNVERYISKCLTSLQNQTFKNFEVIVIDNGSADSTKKIVEEFCVNDKRFIMLEETKRGVSAARNKGLRHAKGQYIMFVDADDYVEPDFIQIPLQCINEQHADIVAFNLYEEKEDGLIAPCSDVLNGCVSINVILDSVIKSHLEGGINGFLFNKIYKRTLIEGLQFREDITMCEDALFLLEYVLKSKSFYLCSSILYHYVRRETSACGSGNLCPTYSSKFISHKLQYELIKDISDVSELTKYNYASKAKQTCIELSIFRSKHNSYSEFLRQTTEYREYMKRLKKQPIATRDGGLRRLDWLLTKFTWLFWIKSRFL